MRLRECQSRKLESARPPWDPMRTLAPVFAWRSRANVFHPSGLSVSFGSPTSLPDVPRAQPGVQPSNGRLVSLNPPACSGSRGVAAAYPVLLKSTWLSSNSRRVCSRSIASFSQVLERVRSVIFNWLVLALAANSAQRSNFRRYSLGSPGIFQKPWHSLDWEEYYQPATLIVGAVPDKTYQLWISKADHCQIPTQASVLQPRP